MLKSYDKSIFSIEILQCLLLFPVDSKIFVNIKLADHLEKIGHFKSSDVWVS